MDQNTERFIYADDLCVISQENTFEAVEANLTSALDELLLYYERNHLHANPAKTQVCSFHLRNRETNRHLNIKWPGTTLEHCTHPVYLGVTLDRTLSFKEPIKNTKSKVGSRNNILRKLTNSKWGATAHIKIHCSGLVLFLCGIWMSCLGVINSCQETWPSVVQHLPPDHWLLETHQHKQPAPPGIVPADIRREWAVGGGGGRGCILRKQQNRWHSFKFI